MKKLLKRMMVLVAVVAVMVLACTQSEDALLGKKIPGDYLAKVDEALGKAGENRPQLIQAIKKCPKDNVEGLAFLLANMSDRDLKSLTAEFLSENVNLAYQVMEQANWGKHIPNEIFLNYVLPYVSLHERRDNWRADFNQRFFSLVENDKTSGDAAMTLNEKIWDMVNVHYNTKRPKADQSPYESIEATMASCTGLSILLVDACRSVGVPARFVGVPLWADHSGNHSWVEIWDEGWQIVGAGEPGPLNETWFIKKASLANDSDWKYGIYAASFKKTEVVFPPLFDKTATYVHADIVTNRYSSEVAKDSKVALAIRLFDKPKGERILGKVTLMQGGKVLEEGETRDERRDINDFLVFKLEPNQEYQFKVEANGIAKQVDYKTESEKYQFLNIALNE